MINRGDVTEEIDIEFTREKVAGHLPQVIERARKAAAPIAKRQVFTNSVAPAPEVWAAATVDRPNDLALLVDSTDFGHRRARSFDYFDNVVANFACLADQRSCAQTK